MKNFLEFSTMTPKIQFEIDHSIKNQIDLDTEESDDGSLSEPVSE